MKSEARGTTCHLVFTFQGEHAPKYLLFTIKRSAGYDFEITPEGEARCKIFKDRSGVRAEKELKFSFINDQGERVSAKYNLIGLIEHHGDSGTQGHYIARLFRGGVWKLYNDRTTMANAPPDDQNYRQATTIALYRLDFPNQQDSQ